MLAQYLRKSFDVVEGASDEEARLPIQYRRAYRFIARTLGDEELSVKAVAAHIGRTDRALQIVWKRCLGCGPADTIRRLRAEAIQRDLMETDLHIGDIAARWGIHNRATLAAVSRTVFGCTPSQIRSGAMQP